MWLLQERSQPTPLKHIYLALEHAETAVRATVRQFVEVGLLKLEGRDGDRRYRMVRTTSKFDDVTGTLNELVGAAAAELAGADRKDEL